MRIIAVLSILAAVAISIVLYCLVSDYNEKEQARREELSMLNKELYEENKNSGDHFGVDSETDPYISGGYSTDTNKSPDDTADTDTTEYNGTTTEVINDNNENDDFYTKLKNKEQVNVLFVGDGITEGNGVDDYNRRWVNRLVNEIETSYGAELKGYNYGKENSDAFYGYSNMSFRLTYVYDLVVVCYGAKDDPNTFKMYYDGLLRAIKNQNPKCEIYCIIEANPLGYGENADAVREICSYYGGVCIDVNAYFKENNIDMSETLVDLIPNEAGNLAYYWCISAVLAENLVEGREVPSVVTPNYSTTKYFDNYRVIRRNQMQPTGNTVFEFSVRGNTASLVYFENYSNGGDIKVYVNDEQVINVNNKSLSDVDSKKLNFMRISTELYGVNKIRIETDTADNAFNIYGVAISGDK
ncbi:MAG: SGNH/GDSL hydrolase family protein [Clostridia bacterium]|nr:SGNH/GDSL hydrolase family protein [Clostridia bacterium]